jgi:cytochrome c oxidase subunit 1/cytochrome c oxidase subunit I+III
MFATGIPLVASSFFSGASFIITIPSAIAVFAWIATIWTGRPVFTTAFHYFAGFIVMFVIGGVSGVMTASVPADLQLTDTYFVVAHLHYVLIGINLFGVLGALYFWFPKMSGRLLGERLGKVAFWITFTGFNLAFLPMHLTGLMGMPRRVWTYPAETGWGPINMVSTVGSFLLALGILLVLVDILRSLRHGEIAGPNPWDAPTLEWSIPSPPPPYNFALIPTVASRHPLWEDRLAEGSGRSMLDRGFVLDDGKETLATTIVDAEPDIILKMPDDSPWPFITALVLCALFTSLLVRSPVTTGIAGLAVLLSILAWLWPKRRLFQIAGPQHG